MDRNEFFPAEPLIPQRRRMKLLEWVKRPTEQGLLAETTANADWPLHRDGMVSSVISIELVAQAIAALKSWRGGEGASACLGLLVGVKEAEFSAADFPVGTRLVIQVKELYHVGDYAVYEGQVGSEADFLCKTIIQVMETEEEVLANLQARQRIRLGEKERKT